MEDGGAGIIGACTCFKNLQNKKAVKEIPRAFCRGISFCESVIAFWIWTNNLITCMDIGYKTDVRKKEKVA
jgi:hypothetical protein